MRLILHPDELHRHHDPVFNTPHAAFDQKIEAQLAADAGDVFSAALVTHRGGASNHGQALGSHRGQLGDDLIGHRITDVFLAGIAA
jgi:hypothetical protein